MKKLINNPDNVVDEMVQGFLSAYPQYAEIHPDNERVLINAQKNDKKVGLVAGGGSGHEPAFFGLIGKGLLDGVAIGNVFASPPPGPILEATKAVNGEEGVLHLIINYAGDRMNFDMAAELAEAEGIKVEQVVVTDDVASSEKVEERRGIAGAFFVYKVAGAAAEKGYTLEEVAEVAKKANNNVRTMGIGISPCYLPHSSKPNFEIGEDEMEIGLGIHGEPGVEKGKMQSADEVAEILYEMIMEDMPIEKSEDVAVLVNGLGSTTNMELFIINNKVNQLLNNHDINVYCTYVDEFVTSLEMGGCSVSIMKLDEELKALIKYPADTPSFVQVNERGQ